MAQKNDQNLKYLYGLNRLGTKFGLENTFGLLELLGNPHQKIKSIHIAGTNGKGSTSAMISSIMQEAGYKVGLYTSPHLVKFNERIQVNGKSISNKDLIRLVKLIKKKIKENNKMKKKKLQPTFFEFTTALTFYYFKEKKVDFMVVEVGMGGRLDSTNVINPLVSVITNIGWDHMYWLGNTLPKIAKEKAGIIKENSIVVTAEKRKSIQRIFAQICKEKHSKLYLVDKNISTKLVNSSLLWQEFICKGMIKGKFKIKLLGNYQLQNAAISLLAVKLLEKKGIKISKGVMQRGLYRARWPGRLDVIYKKPLIIFDGSHNINGFVELHKFAKKLPNRKVLLIGMAKDKEIKKMIPLIVPLFEKVIITKGNFKPAPPTVIRKEVLKYNKNCEIIPDSKKALFKALKLMHDKYGPEDSLLATGSLYLVGDLLKHRKEVDKFFKG